MLPEHLSLSDVTFMVNGQVIGRGHTQEVFGSLAVDQIYEIGNGEPQPLRYEGTVEMKDCEFHPEWFAFTGQPCDITVSRGEYLPPRQLRSKKKRIVRKWQKQYTFNKETTTYKNCTITGMEEK